MLIVLDSSVIVADPRLKGPLRTLLEAGPRLGLACCVPAIVLDEVVIVYRRQLDEAAAKLEKAFRTWERLTGEAGSFTVPDDATRQLETVAYRQFLETHLDQWGARVLAYPRVPHEDLVQRAASRRKPFAESGSGYRDALIWATVVELATEEQRRRPTSLRPRSIVFATQNTRDFAEGSRLHHELAADLPLSDVVSLVGELRPFVSAEVLPHLGQLEDALRSLQEGTHPFSLAAWIDSELAAALNDDNWAFAFVALDEGHARVRVTSLAHHEHLQVKDVRRLPSGHLLVHANTDVEVEVVITADRDDFVRYPDVAAFFGYSLETNWVDASVPAGGNVAFNLTLNQQNVVQWVEIDEVRGTHANIVDPRRRRLSEI